MDIDIDFANRDKVLGLVKHVPAAILRKGEWVKHNTGVFVTDVPQDPLTGLCTLDYEEAEKFGYVKLDLLNVSVYEQVKSVEHLDRLLSVEPRWDMLQHREFVEQVIHINNHFDLMQRMEPIDTVARMAMFLAVIRPAKRHLVGKPWQEVGKEVWIKPTDGSYAFKKGHGVAYAHLVSVHMNLLCGL